MAAFRQSFTMRPDAPCPRLAIELALQLAADPHLVNVLRAALRSEDGALAVPNAPRETEAIAQVLVVMLARMGLVDITIWTFDDAPDGIPPLPGVSPIAFANHGLPVDAGKFCVPIPSRKFPAIDVTPSLPPSRPVCPDCGDTGEIGPSGDRYLCHCPARENPRRG